MSGRALFTQLNCYVLRYTFALKTTAPLDILPAWHYPIAWTTSSATFAGVWDFGSETQDAIGLLWACRLWGRSTPKRVAWSFVGYGYLIHTYSTIQFKTLLTNAVGYPAEGELVMLKAVTIFTSPSYARVNINEQTITRGA